MKNFLAWIIKEIQERLLTKSAAAVLFLIIIYVKFHVDIDAIVNDYIKSPEFKGFMAGVITTILSWLLGKKG